MSRPSTPSLLLFLIYLSALAVTTALLVFWVVVVQRFDTEINQLISRLGVEWNHFHWFIQSFGVGLFFLVIVALTYLLAVTLAERRYSRKQDVFLSNMTHELKSPLAAIKLHAQTLDQGGLADHDRRVFVGYILQESERVARLVDNLLASSRLLSGREARLEPINLGRFFAEYQEAVRGRFDLREIDLTFEIQTHAVVMATSDGLQRVVDNLIDNALRFTRAGGRVRLEVRDGATKAEIIVADNGIGIPKRELPRIFDRFYRIGKDLAGRRKGTGLGLSIVRELVEEMRGSIRAVSQHGEPGSRFEIQLPTVDETTQPATAAHASLRRATAHPPKNPGTL